MVWHMYFMEKVLLNEFYILRKSFHFSHIAIEEIRENYILHSWLSNMLLKNIMNVNLIFAQSRNNLKIDIAFGLLHSFH